MLVAQRARTTVRFFHRHRWLLRSKEHRVVARKTFVRARVRLLNAERKIALLRAAIQTRKLRALRAAPPRVAICEVFQEHCREAVSVAWCESRLQPRAQNGQYLGLFQMGHSARRLFGHGRSSWSQAVAAHRYFVSSGRDWSPWGCKPATGF